MPSQFPQPVAVDVRRAWMRRAVKWACRRLRFTIDRRGMNPRGASEKLDDIAMGEIASISVMQFLSDKGRSVVAYDQVRADDYKDPDPGSDVAVSRSDGLDTWRKQPPDPKAPPEEAHLLSVKSSRIPPADGDDIHAVIASRDFKVFKKSADIESDLPADFEVQVYYENARSKPFDGLKTSAHNIENEHVDAIIDDLGLEQRYGRCYITGFCARERIIEYSRALADEGKKRTWPSWHAGYKRTMWVAPLCLGISPHRLADA